jgi:hypothetical protein
MTIRFPIDLNLFPISVYRVKKDVPFQEDLAVRGGGRPVFGL